MVNDNQAYQFDAFISYAHKNQRTVIRLIKRLRQDGFEIWVDEEQMSAGCPLDDVLADAISRARHFIVCLSSAVAERVIGVLSCSHGKSTDLRSTNDR